jgi:hypothetical protein
VTDRACRRAKRSRCPAAVEPVHHRRLPVSRPPVRDHPLDGERAVTPRSHSTPNARPPRLPACRQARHAGPHADPLEQHPHASDPPRGSRSSLRVTARRPQEPPRLTARYRSHEPRVPGWARPERGQGQAPEPEPERELELELERVRARVSPPAVAREARPVSAQARDPGPDRERARAAPRVPAEGRRPAAEATREDRGTCRRHRSGRRGGRTGRRAPRRPTDQPRPRDRPPRPAHRASRGAVRGASATPCSRRR